MFRFWHDVELLEAITAIIFRIVAAFVVLIGLLWFFQMPKFSIQEFQFVGETKQMNTDELEKVLKADLGKNLTGGFFSMDLLSVQESIKKLSWIKESSVKRVWPHTLEISIQAYHPIAKWKNDHLLSPEGIIYDGINDSNDLLLSEGPDEAAALVAQEIPIITKMLAPLGWKIKKIMLTDRYSWQVHFSNNWLIELGRSDTQTALSERAQRLAKASAFIKSNTNGTNGGYIDMRYPNGFAMSKTINK